MGTTGNGGEKPSTAEAPKGYQFGGESDNLHIIIPYLEEGGAIAEPVDQFVKNTYEYANTYWWEEISDSLERQYFSPGDLNNDELTEVSRAELGLPPKDFNITGQLKETTYVNPNSHYEGRPQPLQVALVEDDVIRYDEIEAHKRTSTGFWIEHKHPRFLIGEFGEKQRQNQNPSRETTSLVFTPIFNIQRAWDTLKGCWVVIKSINKEYGKLGTELRGILEVESKASARLKHPNIVGVDAFFVAGEESSPSGPIMIQELVEGQDLQKHIDEGNKFNRKNLVALAEGIASGLSAIEEAGLSHRDIKPGNIIVGMDSLNQLSEVKIADFGLAAELSDPTVSGLHPDGSLVGTLQYLSPEELFSQPLQKNSDTYSFGVVMFELISGRYPFNIPDGRPRRHDIVGTFLEPRPYIPIEIDSVNQRGYDFNANEIAILNTIFLKVLATKSSDRYANAYEFTNDLLYVLKRVII